MFPNVARFLTLIFLLAIFHIPSDAQPSPENGNAGNVSESDRLLLEKIDRLERRIAELEARAGIESTRQQSAPAASASGKLSQEAPHSTAETSAANSSAAPTEAKAPFAFADFTWLKRQQPHQGISAGFQGLHRRISCRR
ncbi:MAG TPA: hypothetical protein VGK36_15560 [Candidatus Angelobacter sp.]|jgi:hypothetical protein